MKLKIFGPSLLMFNLLLIICLNALCVLAAEVNLAWDASSGNPTGYRIYYGTSQGSHPHGVDVGNVTEYTLTGLEQGVTYYFVARAYK